MDSQDPRAVMILPTEAQSRFERAAGENARLTNALEAQNMLFAELADSLPGDEVAEKLKKTEEELAIVNHQLEDAQSVLCGSPQDEKGSEGYDSFHQETRFSNSPL